MIWLIFLSFLFACQQSQTGNSIQKNSDLVDVIAFGSCSKQDYQQVLWDDVLSTDPDLWIWLGDNIYADTDDMIEVRKMYQIQKTNPEYQELRTKCHILGTWDDHDYGLNDGGKEFLARKKSKVELFRFLDIPDDSPAWMHDGVYQSYLFGPEERKIKIILLDSRSFRDKQYRTNGRYIENPQGDILGEEQWKWLEKQLTDSNAAIHIIGNGIQFLSEEHRFEKWANFPKARKRLFDIIKKTKPNNLVLLSGDRHIAEISKKHLEGYSQPVYDITSSGLTHSYHVFSGEPNKYRIGTVTKDLNFAVLKIDWSQSNPKIIVEIRGDNGITYQTHELEL